MKKTYVYIDGFNLYHRALQGTDFKWLDVKSLCNFLLRDDCKIEKIKYFTARVRPRPNDPDVHNRQDVYLRALQTIPELEIYEGHFLTHNKWEMLAKPTAKKKYVEIIKTEEKGSDVNMAVHLLNDAWLDNYDVGVLITNDSDLAESMRLVKLYHKRKALCLFTPGQNTKTSFQLKKHSDFTKTIRNSALRNSQFDDCLLGGKITKPNDW